MAKAKQKVVVMSKEVIESAALRAVHEALTTPQELDGKAPLMLKASLGMKFLNFNNGSKQRELRKVALRWSMVKELQNSKAKRKYEMTTSPVIQKLLEI